MLSRWVATTLVCMASFASTVRADGLVYLLPADGVWAQYELSGSGGQAGNEMTIAGTVTMSSVGNVIENGEPCRWIEVKMVMKVVEREQPIIAKVLIPEKHFGKGKSPCDNVIRGWIKMRDQEPQPLNDLKSQLAGPLPAFLSGPLLDQKELGAVEVESKLGKLLCAGVTGRNEFMQVETMIEAAFETRLSEKAPFGIVTSQMTFGAKRNGEVREKGTLTFKLTDFGKSTLTELPNNN